MTFALNLVPTGGALDNLTQGNYTEAGISAAADSLLLAGGIVKALSASRASLTAAQAARLNAATQAITRAETTLNFAVGGYRAEQSYHNFTNKDGSKAEGAGQAGEALLRILGGAVAAGRTDRKGRNRSDPSRSTSKNSIMPDGQVDHAATVLGNKFGGQASVRIDGFGNREFDFVSGRYVGQTFGGNTLGLKPKNFLSKSRRNQIKRTLDAAKATGRQPLFNFEGIPPHPEVVDFIQRNAQQRGVTPKITNITPVQQ